MQSKRLQEMLGVDGLLAYPLHEAAGHVTLR